MSLSDLLNRQEACAPDNSDEPFAESSTNLVEPSCNQWDSGLDCAEGNPFPRINWLFNSITGAIKSISDDIQVLASSISNNSSNISTNSTDITNLTNQVGAMPVISSGCGIDVTDGVVSVDGTSNTVASISRATGNSVVTQDFINSGGAVFDVTPYATVQITNPSGCRNMLVECHHILYHLQIDITGLSILQASLITEYDVGSGFITPLLTQFHVRMGLLSNSSNTAIQSEQCSGTERLHTVVIPPGGTIQARTKIVAQYSYSPPENLTRFNGPAVETLLIGHLI